MPANNMKGIVHYFAGKYIGKIGLLLSPNGWRPPPWYMPYALDNGAFTGFDAKAFKEHLCKPTHYHAPLWVVVPDCVGNAEETNRLWHEWKDKIQYPKAFAVQDGHEPQDVPKDAFCVFVGGSTGFKLKYGPMFKGSAKWMHIGRVNTYNRLIWAEEIGADSVDGTGFFRSPDRTECLIKFLEEKHKCFRL